MPEYIYSPRENAFFAIGIKDSYEAADFWPEDGVTVEPSVAAEFMGKPPEGKTRSAGFDGFPVWADRPEPTPEERSAAAVAEKQLRIDQAIDYINSRQWPGKAAMGRLRENEKSLYNRWLDYLDALEAIDTIVLQDLNWPDAPEK